MHSTMDIVKSCVSLVEKTTLRNRIKKLYVLRAKLQTKLVHLWRETFVILQHMFQVTQSRTRQYKTCLRYNMLYRVKINFQLVTDIIFNRIDSTQLAYIYIPHSSTPDARVCV